jgi:hypothetical protein
MADFVKGKAIIGPSIAIIGGLIWMIGGIVDLANRIVQLLELLGLGYFVVPFLLALLFGVISIIGGLLAATGYKLGNYITIITGLIGIIGLLGFITTLIWIDPVLVLIGGVLGVVIKE